MSRLYMLIPTITLFFVAGLILLITFGWYVWHLVVECTRQANSMSRPPNRHEQKHGQTYPHPFMWKPLLIGIFASCTVQTIRVPVWEIIAWFDIDPTFTTFL